MLDLAEIHGRFAFRLLALSDCGGSVFSLLRSAVGYDSYRVLALAWQRRAFARKARVQLERGLDYATLSA